MRLEYRKLKIESSAGKYRKAEKIITLIASIIGVCAEIIMVIHMIITFINHDLEFFVELVACIIILLPISAIISQYMMIRKALKRNKKITLYLYKIDEFVKLMKIPSDKKIVFSDTNGAILCNICDVEFYNDYKYFNEVSFNGICELFEKSDPEDKGIFKDTV